MANSKIIIIEGAQGAGKTTVTDYIRHSLKHTNLYRLSGTQDATPAGKQKAKEMYEDLLEYMKKLENKSINLLFDRTFFTEENYCRLGKKEYTFTDIYEKLLDDLSKLDFEIYYITLYLKDGNEYEERIKREGKAEPSYAKFSAQNSIDQQITYLQMAEEVRKKYPNIHTLNIQNDRTIDEVQHEINQILKI